MVCLDHKRVELDRKSLKDKEEGWIMPKPKSNEVYQNEAIKEIQEQLARLVERIEKLEDQKCSCNCNK